MSIFTVSINHSSDVTETTASATGSITIPVTTSILQKFGFSIDYCKNKATQFMSQRPDNVYFTDPANNCENNNNNLFEQYNWDPLQLKLVIHSCHIINNKHNESTIIASNTQQHMTPIIEEVLFDEENSTQQHNGLQEILSIQWNQSYSPPISPPITITTSINNRPCLQFVTTIGLSNTATPYQYITNKTSEAISLPNQILDSQLISCNQLIQVEVVFRAYLIGGIVYTYNHPLNGHYSYYRDINNWGVINQLDYSGIISSSLRMNGQNHHEFIGVHDQTDGVVVGGDNDGCETFHDVCEILYDDGVYDNDNQQQEVETTLEIDDDCDQHSLSDEDDNVVRILEVISTDDDDHDHDNNLQDDDIIIPAQLTNSQ